MTIKYTLDLLGVSHQVIEWERNGPLGRYVNQVSDPSHSLRCKLCHSHVQVKKYIEFV